MSEPAKPFSDINFGLLIAFFLPGFLGLYALRPFSQTVNDWFVAILDKDKTVGASFLLLASSLVVGLIISAARDILLDRFHHFLDRYSYFTKVTPTNFEYGKFIDPNKKAALDELISNKYRFYQFYGNTMLGSLLLLMSNFKRIQVSTNWIGILINLAVVVLLFVASREALIDMFRTYEEIIEKIDNP